MTKQALLCPRKNCGTASQPAVCSPANSSAAAAFLIFPTSNATHDCGTGRLSSHLSVPKPDSAACGNCQKAAEQIDIAILPKSLEARFKGFQWLELQRLAPVLVVSKKNPLAKLTRIHPEKWRFEGFFRDPLWMSKRRPLGERKRSSIGDGWAWSRSPWNSLTAFCSFSFPKILHGN